MIKQVILIITCTITISTFGQLSDVNIMGGNGVINIIEFYNELNSANIKSPESVPNWQDYIMIAMMRLNDSCGGGIIFLPAGTYLLSAPIKVTADYINTSGNTVSGTKDVGTPITIKGVGFNQLNDRTGGTVLKPSSFNSENICIQTIGAVQRLTVSDLEMRGRETNNGYAILSLAYNSDQTPVKFSNTITTARCEFKNLKISIFKYGIFLNGYADVMTFENIKFSDISRCMWLKHCEASIINKISAEPFYDYMFYLNQCSGINITNTLARSIPSNNFPSKVFIITANSNTGQVCEINGLHAESVHNIATISAPNVAFKNVFYGADGYEIKNDSYILSSVSGKTPENVTIENHCNSFVGNAGYAYGFTDVALRTGTTRNTNNVEAIDTNGTIEYSSYGNTCNGLRIINSDLDLNIPEFQEGTNMPILIEKITKGTRSSLYVDGTVAIGTTTPESWAKLHVNGKIKTDAVYVGDKQIVGPRQPHIQDVSNHTISNNSNAINAILQTLRLHGLIEYE